MKKLISYLVTGIIFVLILVGCLPSNNDIPDQTYEQEKALLKSYLDTLIANGRDIDTTALGAYYVVLEEGEGERAKPGDTLSVGYAGYFIDGELFESSEWYNPDSGTIEFVLGEKPIMQGWDDGMKVMNKNEKIQLIIPSDLAYGKDGSGLIPPYQTLVFIVKMVDIKPVS